MSTFHLDKEFIEERQARYCETYNSHNVNEILEFMSEDIQLSDYSVGMLNLNKAGVHNFYTNMFASCSNLKLETVSVSGHKSFTAWEWNLTFNFVKQAVDGVDEAELQASKADGRLIKMVGVSISWWSDDDKIIKNHDYAKVVENFEGK